MTRESKYQIAVGTVIAALVTAAFFVLTIATDWSLDLLAVAWALCVGFGATHAGDYLGIKLMKRRDAK